MSGDLLLLATVCLIGMLSPGPDFVLIIRNSLKYERLPALATSVGIVVGCFIHATYCILGLAVIITQSIVVYAAIKYLGALYLIYLGLRGILSRDETPSFESSAVRTEVSVKRAFFEGFWCNLLNPKLAVFLLSLFTQFIPADASMSQKLMVAGVFVAESVVWWPVMVLLLQGKALRRFYARFSVWMDRLFGGLMVGLGLRVALVR